MLCILEMIQMACTLGLDNNSKVKTIEMSKHGGWTRVLVVSSLLVGFQTNTGEASWAAATINIINATV